jgi:hypothetical protein
MIDHDYHAHDGDTEKALWRSLRRPVKVIHINGHTPGHIDCPGCEAERLKLLGLNQPKKS